MDNSTLPTNSSDSSDDDSCGESWTRLFRSSEAEQYPTGGGSPASPLAHPLTHQWTQLTDEGRQYNGKLGLRVAAIFIILVTSAVGTLFPLVSRRYRGTLIPVGVYDFAKYFGSGVIIATAFIHVRPSPLVCAEKG